MAEAVSAGDRVRLYEEDDWFYEGMVLSLNEQFIIVDFDDWIERFPLGSLRAAYIHFQRILIPISGRGEIVQDFRSDTNP